MNLTKKTKCSGCMALDGSNPKRFACSLGYGIRSTKVKGAATAPVPLEPCPKPLNKKELTKAKKLA